MRIETLRTYVVNGLRANHVFVEIGTDAGIVGYGEGTVEFRELAVEAAIHHAAGYLVGQDPFRIALHVERLTLESYWRTGVMLRSALSAIEVALHDIKARALGIPVYDLLGGRARDDVRCYANAWFGTAKTPDEFAQAARETVADGFVALKFDPFDKAWGTPDRAELIAAYDRVAAVRDAVGDEVEIMIDGHGRFEVATAITVSRELAAFRPYWFEEPVSPEDIASLVQVRRRSPIPIAAGERIYERARFIELVEREAVDFLQPDISHVGGLNEALLIAGHAWARGIPVVPHNAIGPLNAAATLHFAAAAPAFPWLETFVRKEPFIPPWRDEYVTGEVLAKNGRIAIPDSPGLGVTLHSAGCLAHPYTPRNVQHFRRE
ncbi:mandelate racemase/muconate lactonizing enzyme family protein [Comamonadaceae bacterium PP-2]